MIVTGLPAQVALTPETPDGVRQPRQFTLSVADHVGKRVPKEFTFRLDLSGLKGAVSVEAKPCELADDQATCTIKVTNPDRVPGVALTLRAASGSKAGDAGLLRVTGEADGQPVQATTATVEVGGANLVAAGKQFTVRPAVGDTEPLPVSFRNVGKASATGVLMAFRFTEGTDLSRRFANCSSAEGDSVEERHIVLCSFDVNVPAGGEFRLPDEAALKVGTAAFRELVQVSVFPDAPGMLAYLRAGRSFEQGSGSPLTLVTVGDPSEARYGNDNTWLSPYYVTNTADLSVTGARVSAGIGDEVVAELGLSNEGPAWLGDAADPTEFASVEVELPDGVTVVDRPKACLATSGNSYVCPLGPLASDARVPFPFKLKLDKALRKTHGTVRVRQADWSTYDKNAANDSADIDFVTEAATASATATASTTPEPGTGGGAATGDASPGATATPSGTSTGDAASGGGLASTGAGTAAWSAALAALLIGAGVTARAVTRRRRA